MSVLIIAEHDNRQIKPATLTTITAAQQLANQISVLVIGADCQTVAEELATINGVSAVLCANNPAYEHLLPENLAILSADVAKSFRYVLAPATTFGKNLLPRIAALLDVGQLSDVIKIIDATTFKRPIYAGNAVATVQSLDPITVLSIRPTAFAQAEAGSARAPITALDQVVVNQTSQFIGHELTKSIRPELGNAKIVISGGRGLQSGENFKLLEQLADCLQGAALGASRAAVDAGFVPNDYQVGQTGKIVAPELYIAIGISGAIQHLAGMKDSKTIVAINKDPEAPIFQIADYGLVADLFKAVPELIDALRK